MTETRAVIITIGTELTDGRITDTNSRYLAQDLEQHGARVALALSVPDDPEEIATALGFALGHDPALIMISGGLGPTGDDLTAPALASALGKEIKLDPQAEAMVRDAVGSSHLKPHQEKQAMLPAGANPIPPAGTAPGFILMVRETAIIVLPGVPSEMEAMWDDAKNSPPISTILKKTAPSGRRALCFYGTGEPRVGQVVESFLKESDAELEVSICSRYGEVTLEVSGKEEDQLQVEMLIDRLSEDLGEDIYSSGETIAKVIGDKLAGIGETLAVAESCTGGMLGETITGSSGASRFFLGGIIAYSNQVKTEILKVRKQTLDEEGAVSESVARQMAVGARAALTAGYGIGVTGVAGPAGGTREKPVGLVYISVSSRAGDKVNGFNFRGGRDDVRRAAVTAALHMLHGKLLSDDIPSSKA